MISQGDVELSVISKNFFFTFFNFFILFTILGTASGLLNFLSLFGEKFTSATEIAFALATSLSDLLGFYTNFIILQGFGLFPFRLLEFGALSLYPIYLIGAKTPRGKCTTSATTSNTDSHSRLRTTGSTPCFQLWILPAADHPHFYHMRGVQCFEGLLASSSHRPGILYHRPVCTQVPTALCHGASPAFDG
jgi:hypothetical protein